MESLLLQLYLLQKQQNLNMISIKPQVWDCGVSSSTIDVCSSFARPLKLGPLVAEGFNFASAISISRLLTSSVELVGCGFKLEFEVPAVPTNNILLTLLVIGRLGDGGALNVAKDSFESLVLPEDWKSLWPSNNFGKGSLSVSAFSHRKSSASTVLTLSIDLVLGEDSKLCAVLFQESETLNWILFKQNQMKWACYLHT